jgi:hypothetical protein
VRARISRQFSVVISPTGNKNNTTTWLVCSTAPSKVVELEKAWGEWLVSQVGVTCSAAPWLALVQKLIHVQGQTEAAVNHFIEAGAHTQAITAALGAGQVGPNNPGISRFISGRSAQYAKAAQLVADTLDTAAARPFWRRIARHYADAGAVSGRLEWALWSHRELVG